LPTVYLNQLKNTKMSKKTKSSSGVWQSLFAPVAIIVAFIISYYLFVNVMGNPVNFEGGNPKGHPLQGNYLGIIYKGGMIVPILMTCVLTLIIFIFERAITLSRVQGKQRLNVFVSTLQSLLAQDKIEDAIAVCDKQKGSLANVMKAGLSRFRDLEHDQELEKDQKITSMKQALEEATALELPMLSRNMIILATLASISVLIGLIGTVLGMIRAFGALAQSGAPDALALSRGISEALVNTAFGIVGSTLAIIAFNYFSSRIDGYTFKIDEAGFSLTQTFAASVRK
jgi:biopolymer transport protein ExbB